MWRREEALPLPLPLAALLQGMMMAWVLSCQTLAACCMQTSQMLAGAPSCMYDSVCTLLNRCSSVHASALVLHLLGPTFVPSTGSEMMNEQSCAAICIVDTYISIMQHFLCLELVACARHCIHGLNIIARLIHMLQATVKAFSHTSKASPPA